MYRALRNEKEIIEKNKTKKLFLVGNTCDLFSKSDCKVAERSFLLAARRKRLQKIYETSSFMISPMMTLKRKLFVPNMPMNSKKQTQLKLDEIDVAFWMACEVRSRESLAKVWRQGDLELMGNI